MEKDGQFVLELVFNHIHRLRIFNLHVPGSLCVYGFSSCQHLISNSCTYPLFDNHAPNLQNLGLLRCLVDFISPILTSLTDLFVRDVDKINAPVPIPSDCLNTLGGMPSLRWVTLFGAVSSSLANDICPVIHLSALDMLTIDGPFHECVTLVKHLIMFPGCGLRLRCNHAQLGFDQRQLWAIIEKRIDSWATNASNRHLIATGPYVFVGIS